MDKQEEKISPGNEYEFASSPLTGDDARPLRVVVVGVMEKTLIARPLNFSSRLVFFKRQDRLFRMSTFRRDWMLAKRAPAPPQE